MSETPKWLLDDARDRIRAAARQQVGLPPVEPCEPHPRVVPGDPPPLKVAPRAASAPVVASPELVHGPLGHMWLRGIGYDALRSELADGYYPDDTLNP